MAKESFSYGMMVYRIVNFGMFLHTIFQINSLARAMLFLINFKKIIGRAQRSSKQEAEKQPTTINNASLLVTVEQLEQQRRQQQPNKKSNNKTIENANENNLINLT